jgi:hypothetical protein
MSTFKFGELNAPGAVFGSGVVVTNEVDEDGNVIETTVKEAK